MSIRHLSYVACDRCGGNPAQPGDDAREARGIAWREGYSRQDGKDVCPDCSRRTSDKERGAAYRLKVSAIDRP